MAGLALFRADASSRVGSGHVRRCVAVARALRGWRCRFAVSEESLNAVPELESEFEVRVLGPEALFDARTLGDCDLLVTDHYAIGRDYESAAKARQVIAIDDLADRAHACHALTDATPGRDPAAYRGLVPDGAALLLGGAYSPLRPAFVAAREIRRGRGWGKRLFVNFGGTDPDDATGQALDALYAAKRPRGLHVDVVLGRNSPHGAAVAARIARMDFAQLHIGPAEPAAIMEHADIAIGAGGVGALERCALGLPSVVVVIAENQRLVAEGIVKGGGAVTASDAKAAVPLALTLLEDHAALARMARAAMTLSDGRGAARIALWADPAVAKDGQAVRLRPAEADDEARMLAWQRQPETRRFARDSRVPDAQGHRAWFAARRADPDCLFNIVLHGDEPAGVVRLDRRDDGYEVSINIDSAKHGAGIGGAALSLARRLVPEAPLLAHVEAENAASRALFARAGYARRGDWLVSRPRP